MIDELGCLDQLVGRSHECDYPPAVLSLPVVSKAQIDINASSAQIDAQIKELAQAQQAAQAEDPALKALSIYAIDVEQLPEEYYKQAGKQAASDCGPLSTNGTKKTVLAQS